MKIYLSSLQTSQYQTYEEYDKLDQQQTDNAVQQWHSHERRAFSAHMVTVDLSLMETVTV